MISVAIAIATAGIIVGAVASTGLSNNLIVIVEVMLSCNNFTASTALLCIIWYGATNNRKLSCCCCTNGTSCRRSRKCIWLHIPLIAIHLYVFYYGLMADVTPPVGLASYAAAAISRADPIKTGIQAFWYSLRTGILPIVFIFNNELLLIGIDSLWHGLLVVSTSLIAILVFTSATQGWFINKLRWYEIIIFIVIAMSLFRPGYI